MNTPNSSSKLKSTITNMETTKITTIFENLNSLYGNNLYRRIQCTYDEKENKTYEYGEKNNMTIEDIQRNKGNGNTLSLYVKYIPKMYVVDFDIKILDGCKLKEFLDKKKNLYVETGKGYHYYIFINNMIAFSQQQKIYKDNEFDMDLIKTNNIWEKDTRIANGTMANINTLEWDELKEFFDTSKMTTSANKKKIIKKDKPIKNIIDFKTDSLPVSPVATPDNDNDLVIINKEDFEPVNKMTEQDFERIKLMVLKLDKKRAIGYSGNGNWLDVGMALYNNGDNMNNRTLRLWEEFSKQCNEKYDEMICTNKWMTFSPRQNGLTIGSIHHWLKEDNPEEFKKIESKDTKVNFKELYELQDGSFIKEFNKICMYYEPDGNILYYNNQRNLLRNKEAIARSYFKKESFYIEDEKGKKKNMNPFDIWLENEDRKNIAEIVFKPLGKVKEHELNLWNGFTYKNTGDFEMKKIQHILDHIKIIWADGDEKRYEYFLCWFARILQKPNKKNGVCIGLKSKEGVGKTCILDLFAEIIGKEYYMSCSDLEKVVGKFNFMAQNKLLINFNETNWGGNKQMKGKFKSFITDSTITIEPKGKDPYDISCYSNGFITTNEDWLVDIKGDDRRFNLMEIEDKFKRDEEYYRKIYEFEHLQDLANFFYNYDISEYNPKVYEKSELHMEQVIQSADSVELFCHMIAEGDIRLSDNLNEEIKIDKRAFYDIYNEQSMGTYGTKLNNVHFFRRLRKIMTTTFEIKKANKYGPAKIWIKSINDFTTEYEKYIGK